MSATLQEIVNLLNAQYPQAWATPGDRTGFQVGCPGSPVTTVLVALEASPAVVREAKSLGAQLLLTHHPMIYQPLGEVREDQAGGELLTALIRAGVASISCHTNLDVAPNGLNDYLARALELADVEVLAETSRDNLYKLTVFVPLDYADRVRDHLAATGLGIVGRYSHCSFAVRGQGTYRPLEGARPFQGEVGQLSRAEEVRLEMLAPEFLLPAALERLRESHPYEEVAYDLYPLKNSGAARGFGRIGNWRTAKPFGAVISLVKTIFQVNAVKVWGWPPQAVQRLAVLGGSGGEFIQTARDQRAQIYVTGEVRHHQVAPESLENFAVLEVGHYSSEAVFMGPWAEQLRGFFAAAGLKVKVEVAQSSQTPFGFF